MASLFMNPAECGPANDLKSLGGRLDVDARARRDGFVSNGQYGTAGLSRQTLQPFQALPQSSGFSISSPSHSRNQQQQYQQPPSQPGPRHVSQPPPPSQGQAQHRPFAGFEHATPRASSSSSTASSAWARSFNQHPPSQATPRGRSQAASTWVNEHLQQSREVPDQPSGQALTASGSYGQQTAAFLGTRRTAQFPSYAHAQAPGFMHQPHEPVGFGQQGFTQEVFFPNETYHHQTHASSSSSSFLSPAPGPSMSTRVPLTTGPDQDLSGLRETARQILSDPKVQEQMSGDQDHQETGMDNPFGTSEFFKLMQDLALDQGEGLNGQTQGQSLSNGKQVVREAESDIDMERKVDTEGRSACFFGGFDDPQAELDAELEAQPGIPVGPAFDLDRAVPTVHQPVFDQDGRWVPYHRAKEFKETGMDVPRHLKEALDLAQRGVTAETAYAQEREDEAREAEPENGFDNDGLLEFYGQTRRSKRDPFAADLATREHVERARTGGYTARESQEAWMESEDALDRVLGDEKQEEARRQGYYQERKRGDGIGMDGKYLFVSDNPYVQEGRGMESTARTSDPAGMMELQYQNLLEHEARVLEDPSSSRAWFDLAIKQQELERDDQAIRALLQCISLDPECKEAYLALSVSYTNEGMIKEGHSVLERWVEGSSGLGLAKSNGDDADLGRFQAGSEANKSQRHELLTRELMRMARMMPEGDIDADVQVALGVLFNASEEYEKAQDCFRAALFARQDDWMLYNRLGATLANGGKSEEALQYYEQALNLNPGYVRAMFNVGISLIKLARYRQAARYILDAIRLQHADASSNVKSMKSVTSDILWNTLGTTCMHLERHDLMDACAARELDVLDQEFQEYE